MWKDILTLFKGAGLCEEAFAEAILMLETSHGMYNDALAALHAQGKAVDDLYARDRQINKFERSVRRKIVTHLSVATRPDVNMGLVLTAIVVDIERIGDYTKNIMELAVALEEPFDGLELDADVREVEVRVEKMFEDAIPALKNSDMERARKVIEAHLKVAEIVERAQRGGARRRRVTLQVARARLVERLDLEGPLLDLPSWSRLVADIKAAVEVLAARA